MPVNPNKFIELSLFAIAYREASELLNDASLLEEANYLASISATKKLLLEFAKEVYPEILAAKKIKKID